MKHKKRRPADFNQYRSPLCVQQILNFCSKNFAWKLEHWNYCAFICFVDEGFYFVALQSFDQSLDFFGVFIAFFYSDDVTECLSSFGCSVFASQSIFCYVETSWNCIVTVDYCEVSAIQCGWQSSSFNFLNGYVVWVSNDIQYSSSQTSAIFQSDDALSL